MRFLLSMIVAAGVANANPPAIQNAAELDFRFDPLAEVLASEERFFTLYFDTLWTLFLQKKVSLAETMERFERYDRRLNDPKRLAQRREPFLMAQLGSTVGTTTAVGRAVEWLRASPPQFVAHETAYLMHYVLYNFPRPTPPGDVPREQLVAMLEFLVPHLTDWNHRHLVYRWLWLDRTAMPPSAVPLLRRLVAHWNPTGFDQQRLLRDPDLDGIATLWESPADCQDDLAATP